jgi:hypothetical protein
MERKRMTFQWMTTASVCPALPNPRAGGPDFPTSRRAVLRQRRCRSELSWFAQPRRSPLAAATAHVRKGAACCCSARTARSSSFATYAVLVPTRGRAGERDVEADEVAHVVDEAARESRWSRTSSRAACRRASSAAHCATRS